MKTEEIQRVHSAFKVKYSIPLQGIKYQMHGLINLKSDYFTLL